MVGTSKKRSELDRGRVRGLIRFALVATAALALVATAAVSPASAAITTVVEEVPGTQLLQGVACSTPTTCVAVGYDPPPAQEAVVVPITNGVAGAAQKVPGAQVLYGVSCYSATSCLAVGITLIPRGQPDAGQYAVIVPITNGVAGAAQRLSVNTSLMSIDCPTSTTCVAVGDNSVLVITDGVPGAFQPVADVSITAVACSSATTCTAAGSGPGEITEVGVVVPITAGTPGDPQPVPNTNSLYGIACAGPTTCLAVGPGDFFAGFFEPVVVSIVDGTPGPVQTLSGMSAATGIACAGAEACTAVGFNETGQVVPIVNGTPGPTEAVPGTTGLYGATCPSVTTCYVVGGTGVFPDYVGVVVTATETSDETTLTCTRDMSGPAPVDVCTVSDPNGVRTVQFKNTTTNATEDSEAFDCTTAPTSAQFTVPAGTRYKVFVTDCNSPRNKTTFVLRANGDVNQV